MANSEASKNAGKAVKVAVTVAVAAPVAYMGLARTSLPYWARGLISFVVEGGVGAALLKKAPHVATGLITSGVLVGGLNAAQEIDKRRFLNSPASRTPLPAIGSGSQPTRLIVGSQGYDSSGNLQIVANVDAQGNATAADGTPLRAAAGPVLPRRTPQMVARR